MGDKNVECIEEWRDILGYEGYFQVSNLSRIKSLRRFANRKGSGNFLVEEKIRKQMVGSTGYWVVGLRINGKTKNLKVHRLLCQAFILNPNKFPQVNHKNSIRTDNTLSNLEWCNNSMNTIHAYRSNRRVGVWIGKKYEQNHLSKPITQMDASGGIIKKWASAQEAQDKLGFKVSGISGCANGRYGKKTYRGFLWSFTDEKTKKHPLLIKIEKSGFCLYIPYKGCNVLVLKNGYVVLNEYAKDENGVDAIISKAGKSLSNSIVVSNKGNFGVTNTK